MATKKQAASQQQSPATGAETSAPGEPGASPTKRTFPKRNIAYIGKTTVDRRSGKTIRADAPVVRVAGAVAFDLPPAREQIEKRVFWHARAGEIVAMFPELYKPIIQKGS